MKITTLKELIGFAKDTLPLASALGICLGTLVVVSYTTRIGYFPAGISTGDVLFFLSLSIVSAAIYLVAAYFYASLVSFFCTIIRPIYNWRRKSTAGAIDHFIPARPFDGEVDSMFVGVVSLLFALFVANRSQSGSELEEIAMVFLVSAPTIAFGIVSLQVREINSAARTNNGAGFSFVKKAFYAVATIIPATLLSYPTAVQDPLMTALGVRFKGATVVIEGPQKDALLKAAQKFECQLEGNAFMCTNVEFVLYGIGSHAIFIPKSAQPGQKLRISVPRDKIIVIR